jgi:5-methylcytosine-specific restriction endonuclease McrA
MEEDIPPWTADDDCDKCGKPKIYKKRWEMAERRCKNCEQTWDAQEKQQMERGQVASIELANKKIRELRALPYKDYLQTDHWKSIKTAILQTYGFRCQICNGDGPLHVHHRTYERLGAEDSKDLTVLCKSCHEKFHGVTA